MDNQSPEYYELLRKYEDAQNEIKWLQRHYAQCAKDYRALREEIVRLAATLNSARTGLFGKGFVQGAIRSLLPSMYFDKKRIIQKGSHHDR